MFRSLLVTWIVTIVLAGSASAATTTSTGSGSWSVITWSNGTPSSGVDAIIRANDTVTVDSPSCACSNLFLGDSGSGSPATLNFASGGNTLTVGGTVTFGSASVQGALNMTTANSTLSAAGFSVTNFGSFTQGTSSTVVFTAAGSIPANFSNFDNLQISIPAGTISLTTDTNIHGTLTVDSGANLSDAGKTLNVFGTTQIDGQLTFATGASSIFQSHITINGGLQDLNSGVSHDFQNGLTINGAFADNGNTSTFDTNGPQTIDGSAGGVNMSGVKVDNGIFLTNNLADLATHSLQGVTSAEHFIQGGPLFEIDGAITSINVDFATSPGNTVNYFGAGQTIPGVIHRNILVNGTATLGGPVACTETLSVGATGTLTVPFALTVNNATGIAGTIRFTSPWAHTFVGLVGVSPGAIWDASGAAITPEFQGGLVVDPLATMFTAGSGTYTFDTGPQSFVGTATIPTIAVGSGIAFLNNGILTTSTVTGSGAGEVFVQSPIGAVTISGGFSMINLDSSAPGSSVNYNGAAPQTVAPGLYFNLKISTTGAGGVILGSGAISIAGTFDTAAVPNTVGWSGSGNTISFNGNTPQMIFGGPSLVDANNVVMANPNGVTLTGNDFMVAGNLQFGMGKLNTGPFNLRRDNSAVPKPTDSGASASSHIVGNELVFFGTGAGESFTFNVGDATLFAPVAVSNFNVTTQPGSLIVTTLPGNDPNIATSGLDATKTAKRVWKLVTPDGLKGTFDAVFNFNASEATGNPSNYVAKRFNPAGAGWTPAAVGTKTATSTQVTGIDCTALGEFQLGEIPSNPPIFNSGGITITGLFAEGAQLDYNGSATDPTGLPLTYTWDFGDGTTLGNGAFVQHVYNAGGDFTVTLTASNGSSSASTTTTITILAPPAGASGIITITQSDPPIVDPLDGLGVSVMSSDGGIIQLSIDVNSLTRNAYSVSTDFNGTGGLVGTRTGTSPVIQFKDPGIYVATVSATNSATNVVAGKGRKTLPISNKEVGQPVKYKNDPGSSKIKTGKIGGKFAFPKSTAASIGKADVVTYTGSFELPEGLDLTTKPTFAFSIGNISDSISVDAKGKGSGTSATGFLKKVQVKYPKLAKGVTVTGPGQMATFTVSVSGVGLSSKGFDTEGISATVLPSEKSLKSIPRSIQVAMVFAGAAYSSTATVSLKVSTKGDTGTMGTR